MKNNEGIWTLTDSEFKAELDRAYSQGAQEREKALIKLLKSLQTQRISRAWMIEQIESKEQE